MAEKKNYDETITEVANASNEMQINLEEEHKTESYQETTNIDAENVE